MRITAEEVKRLAGECGFELAGITPALPSQDFARFEQWRSSGFAGSLGYLTDRRGDLRSDPRNLFPEAQTIVCVGKLYYTGEAPCREDDESGYISRYAWGERDYHDILRVALERLAAEIGKRHSEPFSWRVCVDSAPLLERSYAQAAGLGWIGKNTCLINQEQGSWFFLGELLLSIPLPPDAPPPDRCGTCRRCIDACPTSAIVPKSAVELDEWTKDQWTIDARLCISYLTIEERGPIPDDLGQQIGNHIFGCDICQDVCPWNGRAAVTADDSFVRRGISRRLEDLADLGPEEFRALFRRSPVWRAKYEGLLRNVAIAMGNSRRASMLEPLSKLIHHPSKAVSSAASQGMTALRQGLLLEHEVCASGSD